MRPSRSQAAALVIGCSVLAAVIVVAALVEADRPNHKADVGSIDRSARPTPGRLPRTISPPRSLYDYNSAANYVVRPSTRTGGTLRLLSGSDCDSWDPGRVTFRWCFNLQRLITRTLVGYTSVNGRVRLEPDLATSLGHHNADFTQWTYTLQSGLKYANGTTITPQDVEHGIVRIRDRARHDGIAGITTTDRSVIYTLSRPNADFDYLMAMPSSAPVPNGAGPVASGPFEISSYQPKTSVVFTRNPFWSQRTDRIRHPLVDSVRLQILDSLDLIDRRLQAGEADARADGGVQDAFRSQILLNPSLKQNADDPVLPATRYLAVTPSVIPNFHCRRALFYAWNKAAAVRALGGPTSGVPAKSMTPPAIEGYDPSYDPYPSGRDDRGEVAKAKQELQLCGKPSGFTTRIIYDTPNRTDPRRFAADRRALDRVGIKIVPWTLPLTGSWIFTGSPAQLKTEGIGLVEHSGPAEYPTAFGFYEPIASYRTKLPSGQLPSGLDDPTIQGTLDGTPKSEAAWRRLDRAVMDYAVFLPLEWEKTLFYRNPRMTNVICDLAPGSGTYDFVNIGVR